MKKSSTAKSAQNYSGNVIAFSSYRSRPAQQKAIDEPIRTIRKGQSWGNAEDICSFTVSDDLMRGMGIFSGDAVISKTSVSFADVINHSLCVVQVGKRRLLRIVSFEGNNKIGIHCGFSQRYEVYSASEIELIGIVIRVERDFDQKIIKEARNGA